MKRYLVSIAVLIALAVSGMLVNGCKDIAPDPTYVDFGQLRVMDFVTCTPIQIYMYESDHLSDTVLKTPTGLTYGVSTPYVDNLPTARGAGQRYHIIAIAGGTSTVLASTDVTLFPNDKKTWLIFQPNGTTYPNAIVNDNPPAGLTTSDVYFRFINTASDPTLITENLHVMFGDPLHGYELPGTTSNGTPFQGVTPYAGLPFQNDTTYTIYVTDQNHSILGRLSGVSVSPGTFHTITWGGQDSNCRKLDLSGNRVLDDTTRIHLYDDNQVGNDLLPVQQTVRFNFINTLIPPVVDSKNFPDYNAAGGLALVINNNTSYDAQKMLPFTTYPFNGMTSDGVYNVVPQTIPMTGLTYFKCVQPVGSSPSFADSILFRFYGQSTRVISDQLVSFVILDSVVNNTTENKAAIPYDSSKAMTLQVTDQPDPNGGAVIVAANALTLFAGSKSPGGKAYTATALNVVLTVNGTTLAKAKAPSTSDNITVPSGNVTVSASINNTPTAPDTQYTFSTTFNAVSGGIYEVLLTGSFKNSNGNYTPRFMVIRTNP